ncbi:hypothetical protein [Actinomadura sp. GC306]|uniref:hypothetical protein n=1 Tax=Actinomadura sp. GC306 TaxID=2530367 RepID=UPI00244275F6|nr:hypothetical protein [Actinomadura sp. GC306]
MSGTLVISGLPANGVLLGERVVQPGHRLGHLLLVIGLGRLPPVLLQRQVEHRARGGPPHPQVDPPRRHCLELLEHLGDLERAVVVHQHRSRPQPDAGRDHRRRRDQQLGMVRRARAAQMVLGEPDPVEPPLVGMPGGLQRIGQGVPLGGTRRDRPELDDGQFHESVLLSINGGRESASG